MEVVRNDTDRAFMVRAELARMFERDIKVGIWTSPENYTKVMVIHVPLDDGTEFVVHETHRFYDDASMRHIEYLKDETIAAIMLLVG